MATQTTPVPPIPIITGLKPESIKIEPWADFSRQSYSIMGDDFCHTKMLVEKFTAKGLRSTVNIKQTLTNKEGKYNVEDEVKLWFDLPSNHYLYAKIKSTNYVKIHYDHGTQVYNNKAFNFYSSLWTDKSLSKTSFRVGLHTLHPKCNSDNRLKIDSDRSYYWYNRTMNSISPKFKFGLVSVVDLSNRVLQKNNLLFNYIHNLDHEAFLRLENEGFRKSNPNFQSYQSLWDTLTLNYVGKINPSTRLGVEASLKLADNSLKNVAAVVEKKLPEHKVTLKAKVDHNQNIAFVFKRPVWRLESLMSFSVGLGVNNALSEKRKIQHGLQLDFNI